MERQKVVLQGDPQIAPAPDDEEVAVSQRGGAEPEVVGIRVLEKLLLERSLPREVDRAGREFELLKPGITSGPCHRRN